MTDETNEVRFGFEPTCPQRRAMTHFDSDVLVSAGPGSGKTLVLVGRIEQLLAKGVKPQNIAAITFTNKAAVQMRQKLRERMLKRWRHCQADGNETEARRWRSLVWGMDHIQMGTIHSFCTRILRSYPHRAGLDPEFSVLDSYQRRLLLDEIITETVHQALNGADWFAQKADEEALQQFADRFAYSTYRRASYRGILRDVYYRGRSSAVDWQKLQQMTMDSLREIFCQVGGDDNGWDSGGRMCRALKDDEVQKIRRTVEQIIDKKGHSALRSAKVYPPLLEELTQVWPTWKQKLDDEPERMLQRLVDLLRTQHCPNILKKEVKRLHEIQSALAARSSVMKERGVLKAIFCLVGEISRRFSAAKNENAAVDFDDQQDRLLNMLRQHPEIQKKLRRRFTHLLVDEFQDTDGVQWELIRRLGRADRSRGGLFLVGDADQSIYRFRGADVQVYRRAQQRLREGGAEDIFMTDNFRSSRRLLEVFNAGFSGIFDDYVPLTKKSGRVSDGDDDQYPLQMLLVQRQPPDGDKKRQQSRAIARWIGSYSTGEGSFGDVAVLVRSRSTLQPVADQLARHGVPHRVVGGTGFYATQEVTDVRMLLRWLADPADDIALAGLLRSPFFALDDANLFALSRCDGDRLWDQMMDASTPEDEHPVLARAVKRLKWWRRLSAFLGVEGLLRKVLQSSHYIETTSAWPDGDRIEANLDKLCDIAEQLCGQQGMQLAQFARHLETLMDVASDEGQAQMEPEDADVVRVMTIHKAKGLEFPVVIVPNCFTSRSYSLRYTRLFHPQEGLTLDMGLPGDTLHSKLRKWEKETALAEEQRIFYVACTRAKRKLVLTGWAPKDMTRLPQTDFPDLLKEAGAQANSYARWLGDGLCGTEAEKRVKWSLVDPSRQDEATRSDRQVAASEDLAGASVRSLPELRQAVEQGATVPVDPDGEVRQRGYAVTSLLDYHHCPRLYLLRHRLKWPELSGGETGLWSESTRSEQAEIDPLTMGTAAHRVCELLPDREVPAAIDIAVRESGVPEHLPVADNMRKRIRQLIDPLLESTVYGEIKRAHERGRAFSEWAFSCPLLSEEAESRRPYLVGTVDQLYEASDGSWVLVDFKSDRVDGCEMQDRAEHYSFQLAVYRWAVECVLGYTVDRAGFYFLHPGEFYPVNTEAGSPSIGRRLTDAVRQIETEDSPSGFPPNSRSFCSWCGYKFHCDREGERQHGR